MSRILIVAAIEIELAPFMAQNQLTPDTWCAVGQHQVWVSFTGVGPVAATYHIQRMLYQLHPDSILQAGIGGYYEGSGLEVGQTVWVVKDRLADLGVMLQGRFNNIFPENRELENPHRLSRADFPEVAGFTVSTGCSPVVDQLWSLFRADGVGIETMEGYALFYVCRQTGVPFAQLRTVSNRVADERSSWNIPLATKNLAGALTEVLQTL